MKLIKVSMLLALGLCQSLAAQQCYEEVATSDDTDRFVINIDGTVSDTKTGLMWQRCNYGQVYNSETTSCDGDTQSLNWQASLKGALNDTTANYNDWQVPSIKELASIVDHRCTDPSINAGIFLATQSQNYWSNTSGISNINSAWVYQFSSGLNSLHAKTSNVYLRLVRYEK
ncbi:DUF1566 domain-containing protein [Pseudoalteromonas tetraodonis]|uniref:Lcl C-terminal domain-containing protein n=1 Tax=Pseudoalteromonas tetraodonis TaxID=43659 RepID=UPI001BDF2634|nr:DUF1566 domain-containing protein [Pseudoalteromonas tetraodonis]MBT2152805.1 DUF1566 domain-containing protein [Pseudoalteromonas tetraodonis]